MCSSPQECWPCDSLLISASSSKHSRMRHLIEQLFLKLSNKYLMYCTINQINCAMLGIKGRHFSSGSRPTCSWKCMWDRGIMANMVLCVIPGQGNSKILNLVKSGSFDSPIFLYIPNDEKTSTGHLIWPQPFIWQPFLEISCPGMTLWI